MASRSCLLTLFSFSRHIAVCVLLVLCAHRSVAAEENKNALAPSEAPSFQQELNNLAIDDNTVIGIAIRDLSKGEEFSIKGDELFSQTGLSKLHILIALYREVSAGRIDLFAPHTLSSNDKLPGGVLHRLSDDSVTMSLRDYAMLMSIMDDNSAAKVVLEKIGPDAIVNYLDTLETKDIHFAGLVTNPKNPDDNTATPKALAQCLDHLYQGKSVDPRSRDDIFELLSTPRVSSLRSGIPHNVKVASKAGFRGGLRCSAGIVFLQKRPYAIIIMTRQVSEQQNIQNAKLGEKIAAISRLAYSHFSQLEKAANKTDAPATDPAPAETPAD